MRFLIEKKAMVQLLKTVSHRHLAAVDHRGKNQWLRIGAQGGTVELQANGVAMGHPAQVAEEGVSFVRYRGLLELVQSFKVKEIRFAVTPAGMAIETWSSGDAAWFAIFDDPRTAPATMEDVAKDGSAEPSFITPDAMQHWREMVLKSK